MDPAGQQRPKVPAARTYAWVRDAVLGSAAALTARLATGERGAQP
ncbi:MAG: hypothetical protein ACYCTH_08250 [Cellulomonas sp.]